VKHPTDRSIATIHRALLEWRDEQRTMNAFLAHDGSVPISDNIRDANDTVISPIVWRLSGRYPVAKWDELEGNDRILARVLRAYNSSPFIPPQHRLQVRLQPLMRQQLLGVAIDENGVVRGPNLNHRPICPSQLFPVKQFFPPNLGS
jgi:DNA-binding transcriptional MocR family regulator